MGSSGITMKFGVTVVVLEIIFILIIGLRAKYTTAILDVNQYPNFQDVNVMIFMGFGFLMTFLKKYGFSSVSVNMLLSVICIQWTFIVRGLIHDKGEKFEVGVGEMVTSNFGTATVLISFGAVLGKTSPLQLLVMGLIEVVVSQGNEYLGLDKLFVVDIGESMFIHMFGAYFGMAVAFVLYDPEVENSTKEGSSYQSDLFAMIGTVLLWIYWPSFNGGFAGGLSQVAYINTFLSLCACTAMVFAFSSLLDKNRKFDMVHIQNSTLAGGVAVGACANMPMQPFAAMLIGSAAGIVSVIGYRFISPWLASKLRIHDTCGVHNLHGMPAWIATIAAAILVTDVNVGDWGAANINATFHEIQVKQGTEELVGRSTGEQAGYQLLAGIITMGVAVVGGLITGLILKLPIWDAPKDEEFFDDHRMWHLPDDEDAPTEVSVQDSLNKNNTHM